MDKLIQNITDSNLLNNPFFWLIIISVQIIALFLYYPVIEKRLNFIGSRFFPAHPLAIYYLFFIGTVVHELSHLLTSLALFVRVGKINLFGPKHDKKEGGYTLGYVEHERTDPFRGTLIGLAPIFGSALFTYIIFVWVAPDLTLFEIPTIEKILNAILYMIQHPLNIKNFILGYVTVACAMAGNPSKSDLQSVPFAVFFMIIIIGLSVIFGINIDINSLGQKLTFLTPPLMTINIIMFFELITLGIIQIITGLMIRGWGYKAI